MQRCRYHFVTFNFIKLQRAVGREKWSSVSDFQHQVRLKHDLCRIKLQQDKWMDGVKGSRGVGGHVHRRSTFFCSGGEVVVTRGTNFIGVINGPGINGSALVGLLIKRHVSVTAFGTRAAHRHVVNVLGARSVRVYFSSAPKILGPGCGLRRDVLGFSRSTLRSTSILLCIASVIRAPSGGTSFLRGISGVSIPILLLVGGVSIDGRRSLTAHIRT